MTSAPFQTFKAARVTVAPKRSRQVVSERNTFPQMTSLCGRARHRASQGWLHHKGSILYQNIRSCPDLFLLTHLTAWCYRWEHCVLCQKVWMYCWLITTLIRLLCVHGEESSNLQLLVFKRHENMTLTLRQYSFLFNMCELAHMHIHTRTQKMVWSNQAVLEMSLLCGLKLAPTTLLPMRVVSPGRCGWH